MRARPFPGLYSPGIVERVAALTSRARSFAPVLTGALCLLSLAAQAQVGRGSTVVTHEVWPSCAGEGGPPPPRLRGPGKLPWSLQLSALASGFGAAAVGRDARITDLDAVNGSGLYLAAGRVGLCGALSTAKGRLWWNVGYEPYALAEAAQPDHRAWGRLLAAEVGFAPWRWLNLSAGVRKVAFSFGHDEPEALLALPLRPWVSQSIAPDRRAGLTIDDDFGVARVVIGVYQGARNLSLTAAGGMLIAARLVAEPIGPVGNTVTTLGDPAFWRRRIRFSFNASILYEYVEGRSHYAIGADGALHFGPVGVAGEYIYSADTPEEAPVRTLPRPRTRRQGLWLETAVMVWRPRLELAARYDWFDNPSEAGQQFHALSTGLNLYAYGQYVRLQALYTHKFHYGLAGGAPEIRDDLFLLAATLSFAHGF